MGWGNSYGDRSDWRDAEIGPPEKTLCLAETIAIVGELERVLGQAGSVSEAAAQVLEKEPDTERGRIAAEWLRICHIKPAVLVIDDLRALAQRCKEWKP